MSDPAYCWYHDDQASFKSAFSTIRKICHIPQNMSKACAMSVCTCRKGDMSHRTPMTQLEMFETQGKYPSDLLGIMKSDDSIGASTTQFMTDLLVDKNKGVESATRLVYVFKMALDNEYTLLEEELDHRKSKMNSKYKNVQEKKTVNLTSATRCMLARRKRQIKDTFTDKISIGSGRTVFQFDAKIKVILNDVSKRLRPCVIEPDKKRMLKDNPFINSIPVKIWCEKKRLRDVINEVREKMQVARIGRVKYRTKPRYTSYDMPGLERTNVDDPNIIKETKTADYGKKSDLSNSHADYRHALGHVAKTTTVKCYNCQQLQSSLTSSSETTTTTTTENKHTTGTPPRTNNGCLYHPGFVADGKWSCCQQDSNQGLSRFQEHSTHGCIHSQSHKWVYQSKSCTNKSTGGKYVVKKMKESDFLCTVQTRQK